MCQLYLFGRAGEAESVIFRVTECIADIVSWMSSNRLKLNYDKTLLIWLESRYQKLDIIIHSARYQQSQIPIQCERPWSDYRWPPLNEGSRPENLPIVILPVYDSSGRRAVRKSLTMESCEAFIHAFVFSRLDYCNSLLYGINKFQLDMLQSVLRASARLILLKQKFDSISLENRDKLHLLPVRKGIEFKICTTVYKCLHGRAQPYLVEMMLPVTDTPAQRRLRSATRGDQIIPSSKTVRFGPRSFNDSGTA